MRWKKYLTAEEAALFAVGLGEFGTLQRAKAAAEEIIGSDLSPELVPLAG